MKKTENEPLTPALSPFGGERVPAGRGDHAPGHGAGTAVFPAGQQPEGKQEQQKVFQQLVADIDFAGAATAVKFHRAKRKVQQGLEDQGAAPHEHGKRNEHRRQQQGRPAHGNPGQQQEAAEYFKPRHAGGHQVQQPVVMDEIVLPQQPQKIKRGQGLARPGIKKHRSHQPARQDGGSLEKHVLFVLFVHSHLAGATESLPLRSVLFSGPAVGGIMGTRVARPSEVASVLFNGPAVGGPFRHAAAIDKELLVGDPVVPE